MMIKGLDKTILRLIFKLKHKMDNENYKTKSNYFQIK
jgi:hypothetical protein